MAAAFTRSLVDTTIGHDIELVLAVDNDEETVRAVAALTQPVEHVDLTVDYSERYRGSSRAWNDALGSSTGEHVVLAADDLEFQAGWLDAALETLGGFQDGWGLVGFNDGHWGPELSTHYLMSRRFVAEVLGGVVAWDCYRHSFNDREANDRAKLAGRYAWCEDAHVLHRHWIFGDRPQDPTDTRLLADHAQSEREFLRRSAAGFPDEQEAVI